MTYTNATKDCNHRRDWRLAHPDLPVAGNNPWICQDCKQPVHVDDNGHAVLGSPGANATTLVEFLRDRREDAKLRGETLQALADAMRLRGFPESADLIAETGAQLLADVEAKRRILEMMASISPGDEVNPIKSEDAVALADWTLQILALPFAHHPDYDPSWRPAEVTA